jgi:nitrite reductase/ring-hydroxylating ferredoxin subunit
MKRIFIICCILLSHLSCTDEYDNPIPVAPVYLNLDLTYKDKELKTVPSYKEYTDRDINPALGERRGFGGILVVYTMLGEYKAFDRACPNEVQANITVEVDNEILYATCPKCGSKYEIGFGTGSRSEGVTTHGLRSYSTTLNGSKLIIKN